MQDVYREEVLALRKHIQELTTRIQELELKSSKSDRIIKTLEDEKDYYRRLYNQSKKGQL